MDACMDKLMARETTLRMILTKHFFGTLAAKQKKNGKCELTILTVDPTVPNWAVTRVTVDTIFA